MSITKISRDYGVNPSIVRIVSTDDLSVISASGYIASQYQNIYNLNGGIFQWNVSDSVLIYYNSLVYPQGDSVFGTISSDFGSIIAEAAPSGTLLATNNLSDVSDVTTSFNNISPLTTIGDLIGFDGTNNVRLPVGTNGDVLTADSTAPEGFSWQAESGGSSPFQADANNNVFQNNIDISNGATNNFTFGDYTAYPPVFNNSNYCVLIGNDTALSQVGNSTCSYGFGQGVIVLCPNSFAIGLTASVSGADSCFAIGNSCSAGTIGQETNAFAMGSNCSTTGSNSFALGFHSTITHYNGCYVWSDGTTTTPLSPNSNNQYMVNATGNMILNLGSFAINTIGNGLRVAEGSNAKQGVVTLSSGLATVANTSVTANSRIFLAPQDNNTIGIPRVSARTPGTGFNITSTSLTDSGVLAYEIFEPA